MRVKNKQNKLRSQQTSKRRIVDKQTVINRIIRQVTKTKYRITKEQLKYNIESVMAERPERMWTGGPVAPTGIGVFGIGKDDSPFVVATDAVRGEVDISPDVRTETYNSCGRYQSHRDLTVQLNAFVLAELENETAECYWSQNVVMSTARWRKLAIFNNIHGGACDSYIDNSNVKGGGKVYNLMKSIYYMPRHPIDNREVHIVNHRLGPFYAHGMHEYIPLGRVKLEMRTGVKNGEIIIEFYANGQVYDKVTITPIVRRNGRLHHIPAVSAHIAAAPVLTSNGVPLNLELVVGGVDFGIPIAVLRSGRVSLELYIHKNGAWVPPSSAWSIGYATHEAARARAVPQGVGSVVVEPGEPSLQPLW